jgi:hypothetical protein
VSALLTACLALAGCSTPIEPQILSFNYALRSVPDWPTFLASVQSGQTRISDLLSSNPCNFTADFSVASPPELFTSGTPGQTGFNVSVVALTPVSIPVTTNPPSCPALEQIEIVIGSPSQALALGMFTDVTNGRIWLLNGPRFPISQHFEARVQRFNPANSRSDGQFRFVSRDMAATNTVLIVEGSYAITP